MIHPINMTAVLPNSQELSPVQLDVFVYLYLCSVLPAHSSMGGLIPSQARNLNEAGVILAPLQSMGEN